MLSRFVAFSPSSKIGALYSTAYDDTAALLSNTTEATAAADMNPSTVSRPESTQMYFSQIGFLYPTDIHYIAQQDFKPFGVGETLDFASQTQVQSEDFMTRQSHMDHSGDPSPVAHSQEPDGVEAPTDVRARPATSMGPPTQQRKRKAPTLRADAWEPYKARIIELHITQKLPLPEVRRKIIEESGFAPELRQYRTRITQWGKDKNVKSQEMSAIVRKRQHRKLVEVDKGELTFKVRGNQVEQEKIERWMKRHDVAESYLYAPSPAASTPSAVDCRTISERGSPAAVSAYSPAASILSPRGSYSAAQSPQMLSPALSVSSSVSSIIRPQSSSFAGQSPAPAYQSLPSAFFDLPYTPSAFNGHIDGHVDVETSTLQYRYRQADEERLRVQLSMVETSLGDSHPATLDVLSELGKVLMQQGRYKSAEEAIRRLVNCARRLDGSGNDRENIITLKALCLLGDVLNYQGFYAKAEKLHRRVFEYRRAMLGAKHLDTLFSAHDTGAILWKRGKFQEAEVLLRQTLGMREELLGTEHLDTLYSVEQLGLVLTDQARYCEAEAMHLRVLKRREMVLGPEHRMTLFSMGNLNLTYQRQGRYNEAEKLGVRVTETMERVLGPEHRDTLCSKDDLARTYMDQGRWNEAEELGVQVMETMKRVLGAKHPDTLIAMHNLASILKAQRHNDTAITLMKECFHLRVQVLGPQHPYTIQSLSDLTNWGREKPDIRN